MGKNWDKSNNGQFNPVVTEQVQQITDNADCVRSWHAEDSYVGVYNSYSDFWAVRVYQDEVKDWDHFVAENSAYKRAREYLHGSVPDLRTTDEGYCVECDVETENKNDIVIKCPDCGKTKSIR